MVRPFSNLARRLRQWLLKDVFVITPLKLGSDLQVVVESKHLRVEGLVLGEDKPRSLFRSGGSWVYSIPFNCRDLLLKPTFLLEGDGRKTVVLREIKE